MRTTNARTTARHRRLLAATAIPVALTLALAGCVSDEEASGTSSSSALSLDADLLQAASDKAAELTDGLELADSIEILGPNGGNEGAILQAVYDAFAEGSGVSVDYTGTQDAPNIARSRLQAGNPVDILSTNIGVMKQYAEEGDLVDLSSYMGDELEANYSASLLDAVSTDAGSVFGVYQGFNNFMMWYDPSVYDGPSASDSWDDVTAWAQAEAADGNTAWCLPMEAGASSGFPARQFVEVLFAKKYGPDMLRELADGTLPWTSPEVKDAFQMFQAAVLGDGQLLGGGAGALSSATATGDAGLITDPVQCEATVWGSWTAGLVGATGEVVDGENLDFQPVPGSDPAFANTEIFQAEATGAFNDSPTTRAFLEYVQSTEAQTLLASANQWTVANVNVPNDTYPSELLQRIAEYYYGDEVVLSAGPNVLMKQAVRDAFSAGMVSFVSDPSSLDTVLQSLQTAQDSV